LVLFGADWWFIAGCFRLKLSFLADGGELLFHLLIILVAPQVGLRYNLIKLGFPLILRLQNALR
jgi:hypothetical protein